jgi:hypothetical protein
MSRTAKIIEYFSKRLDHKTIDLVIHHASGVIVAGVASIPVAVVLNLAFREEPFHTIIRWVEFAYFIGLLGVLGYKVIKGILKENGHGGTPLLLMA